MPGSALRLKFFSVLWAVSAVAIPASTANAGTLDYVGDLGDVGLTWTPPDPSGSQLSGVSGEPFHAFSVFVTASGLYSFTSLPTDSFSGLIALYAPSFDPSTPLTGLIGIDYFNNSNNPVARIDAHLIAGVVYRLVTSTVATQPESSHYSNRVTGPGEARPSTCYDPVGDEYVPADDDTMGFAVQRYDFCVNVTWATLQNPFGTGRNVPLRSDDSVLFWFFKPTNWELEVKVLDGCGVNGYYWVFLAGTTNVGFEVEVFGRDVNFPNLYRSYQNPLGHKADAITDTAAFPCADVQHNL